MIHLQKYIENTLIYFNTHVTNTLSDSCNWNSVASFLQDIFIFNSLFYQCRKEPREYRGCKKKMLGAKQQNCQNSAQNLTEFSSKDRFENRPFMQRHNFLNCFFFRYQACPDIKGSESGLERAHCIARWKKKGWVLPCRYLLYKSSNVSKSKSTLFEF